MDDSSFNDLFPALPSLEDFFTKIPLYKSFEINSLNVDQIKDYLSFNGWIDLFCIECNQMSVFRRNILHPPTDDGRSGSIHPGKSGIYIPKPFEPPDYFSIELICSRHSNHIVKFYFHCMNDKIVKIGQYPSYTDIEEENIKKYRKILGSSYSEFRKAIGLISHGIGIGSFVYLRRIFENLIEEEHQKAKINSDWDDNQYNSSRIEEKIKMLKDFLPKFLIDNYSIYSILSKGIHSLSEEECLEYFSSIKVAIELILDEKIETIEKNKKVTEAKKSLDKIKSKI